MTRPVCVLIGAPGAGKSTVGELIAAALGVPFRDTDADIVAAAGKPVSDIFVDDGEDVFRAMERASPSSARFALPEEIALAVLYLASDESLYVTGTNLVLDNGDTA